MDQETIFRNQLEEIVKTARRQGMYLSEDQIKESFSDLADNEDKLKLIQDYLREQKIAIGEENAMEQFLSEEDKKFLDQYLAEIEENAGVSEEEKREIILSAMAESEEAEARLVEIFLPDVAQIAKLYTGQGVYLEDLIGEGNVALLSAVTMLGCLEDASEAEGFIGKFLMDAMERFLENEEDAQKIDDKVLDKVNDVAKAAKELSEEMRRKVSVSELAKESGFSEEEIREALRVCSNQIEEIETEKETDL